MFARGNHLPLERGIAVQTGTSKSTQVVLMGGGGGTPDFK